MINHENSRSWDQFYTRINQIGELTKSARMNNEPINRENLANYLANTKLKSFVLWVAYFGRYPNYEEWEGLKIRIQVDADINQILNFFQRIQKEPTQERVNLHFEEGLCINLQGIKLNGEVSGIPFVAQQIVEKLYKENLKFKRLEVYNNVEISELSVEHQNIESNKVKKSKKTSNIIWSGVHASARELNYSYPHFYKMLKKIKAKGQIKGISAKVVNRLNSQTLTIPKNVTLLSVVPILEEKQTDLLSILCELKLIALIPIIHDVLPLKHNQFFPPGSTEGTLRYIKLCGLADINFAVSEHTIAEVEKTFKYLGMNCPKIELLDLSEMVPFRNPTIHKNTHKKRKYLLYISTFEPRKNHLKLVLIFEKIKGNYPELDLILVGNYGWKNEITHKIINNSTYSESIFILRNISEESKYNLIQNSHVTIYLSKYEGFGLPILESIAIGKKVIHDHSDPLSEFAKYGNSIIVDCDDVDSIYNAILNALNEEVSTTNVQKDVIHTKTFQSFIDYVIKTWNM